ncbi:hypothetical protein Tco_1553701 [Tanacetum coccineum]
MYELGLHIKGSMYEQGFTLEFIMYGAKGYTLEVLMDELGRIRILEGQLVMERPPENQHLSSAAILHEYLMGWETLGLYIRGSMYELGLHIRGSMYELGKDKDTRGTIRDG